MLLIQTKDTSQSPNPTAPMLLIQIENAGGYQHNVVTPYWRCFDGVRKISNFSGCEKGSRRVRFCVERLCVELKLRKTNRMWPSTNLTRIKILNLVSL